MAKKLLQIKCAHCGKTAFEVSRDVVASDIYITLACGHVIVRDALESEEVAIVSRDGKTPFDFQYTSDGFFTDDLGQRLPTTIKFLEDADCNGLCLHEMGLGKTVIECILLSRNKQLLPALIVVKSGLRAQWFLEIFRWTGLAAQVITSSREKPLFEFFPIVIVSIDTLRLLRADVKVVSEHDKIVAISAGRRAPENKKPVWNDSICAQFKHIAVDESQKIKNPGSSRTQALRLIASAWQRVGVEKPRTICYSGTNIEKHAGEFFVTLNLTRPELFPQQSSYQVRWCEINPENGKIGGLKDPKRFKDFTKDFIIRYKREQVLSGLPRIFRKFRLAELEGDELDAYIRVVKEFQQMLDDPERPILPTDILGYLSKMRHITGIAKVDSAVDFTEEFMLDDDSVAYEADGKQQHGGRKLVIFLHHKMASAILMSKLEKLCKYGDANVSDADIASGKMHALNLFSPPLQLHSGLDMNQRQAIVDEFKKPENRILVASTQASGEGLNLQFCSDCLIMERQWNPSIEEQAEARFPRPGSMASQINATYLIAAGTIDDFLTDIVEWKRRNVKQTLDGEEIVWDETSLIAELTKAIQTKGLKKWGVK